MDSKNAFSTLMAMNIDNRANFSEEAIENIKSQVDVETIRKSDLVILLKTYLLNGVVNNPDYIQDIIRQICEKVTQF